MKYTRTFRHPIAATALFGALVATMAVASRRPAEMGSLDERADSNGVRAGSTRDASAVAAKAAPPRLVNRAAYIPAQCYAETREASGRTHNACFACHQDSRAPSYANDADVQTSLSFARTATDAYWTNLFSPVAPAAIADDALLAHVRTSNYVDGDTLRIPRALAHPPAEWDADGDGAWNGFVPDCYFRFDDDAFDHNPTGAKTGWRAFAYAPMPGMFWPTNGSAGDAMIRLPEAFRKDATGQLSDDAYRLNLAIVEAYTRRVDVAIPKTDERVWRSDLDGDGVLGLATRVAFVWPPREKSAVRFVGGAANLDREKDGWPAAGLFPRGTELLHSLRYLDVADGRTRMAPRMKELRYMKKTRWLTYSQLELAAEAEAREKRRSPDRLRWVLGDAERGVVTGTGWSMSGFIEDAAGDLRPQTFEETAACVGCHGGTGVTTDSTFSFARKLGAGAVNDGWYHWAERGLAGIAEPKRADGEGEYARWLAEVGGGDDFRTNEEVRAKFFGADGRLNFAMRSALAKDIAVLVVPSPARAMALDRAYLGLVRAQRFDRGRDVLVGTPPHARANVIQDEPTGIEQPVPPAWRAPERSAARNHG